MVTTMVLFYPPSVYGAPPTDWTSCYDLEESSGTRFDQNLTNTNDLTDNNTVLTATGISGTAADFEKTNSEYLSITDATQTGFDFTGDFSFSVWVKFEQLPSTAADNFFFASKSDPDTNAGYYFAILSNDKVRIFFDATGVGNTIVDTTSATAVSGDVGNWVHYAATVDVSVPTVTIYKNGSSVGTTVVDNRSLSVTGTDDVFSVGVRSNDGTPDGYFDGVLDTLGVYSKILSGTEVTDLYAAGVGTNCAGSGGAGASTPNVGMFLFE